MRDLEAIDNHLIGLGLDPEELQRRLFGQRGTMMRPTQPALQGLPLPQPRGADLTPATSNAVARPGNALGSNTFRSSDERLPLSQPRGQDLTPLATPPAGTATRRVEPLPAPAAPAAATNPLEGLPLATNRAAAPTLAASPARTSTAPVRPAPTNAADMEQYGILPYTPPSPLDRYRTLAGQEPRRDQFPVPKLKTWQKILLPIASFAAEFGRPGQGIAAMKEGFEGPQRERDKKFTQAHQQWEGQLGRVGEEIKLGEVAARTRKLDEKPDKPEDKKIDEYTNADGKRTLTFQRPDGSIYDKTGGDVNLKEPVQRTETPFSLWRKQHPKDDVSEYFKLQPEARAQVKADQGGVETPAQKQARIRSMNLAETQKNAALRSAENTIRNRYGFKGFMATEEWPPEAINELNEMKQAIQDEYETKLSNLGADVTHFDYLQQRQPQRTATRSAGSASQTGKALDPDNPDHRAIAAQILQEAGGDKAKARQIARSRGFKF